VRDVDTTVRSTGSENLRVDDLDPEALALDRADVLELPQGANDDLRTVPSSSARSR